MLLFPTILKLLMSWLLLWLFPWFPFPDSLVALGSAVSCFQILYMWSRNGTGIKYPKDSGMPIGGSSSGINLRVLQVHLCLFLNACFYSYIIVFLRHFSINVLIYEYVLKCFIIGKKVNRDYWTVVLKVWPGKMRENWNKNNI